MVGIADGVRSYRWGKFQGWVTMLGGLALYLAGPFVGESSKRVMVYLVGAVLLAIGVGLLGKKRWGFIIFAMFSLLVSWGAFFDPPTHIEAYFMIAGWWIIPAIFYYPKRWKDFSADMGFSRSVVQQRASAQQAPFVQQQAALLRNKAERGDPDAQFMLGLSYASGETFPRDDAQAAMWYSRAALQGNPYAQANLGWFYENGRGVTQDHSVAANWFRRAAEQGHAEVQNHLGVLYAKGQGVPRDFGQAASWYRKAANQGHAYAQNNLGVLYMNGQGVPRDVEQAAFWLMLACDQGLGEALDNLSELVTPDTDKQPVSFNQQAQWGLSAEQSNPTAQNHLGALSAMGQGIPQDLAQTVAWYRKAAEQGRSQAQRNLGLHYAAGRGVQQDYAAAYFWLYIAASGKLQPSEQSYAKDRDDIAARLSASERSEVRKEADRWIALHEARRQSMTWNINPQK